MYFDRTPRGDLLSRVTNDIDNLAQSLQQTMSMTLISTLTLVGVMIMMITIDLLLAPRLLPRERTRYLLSNSFAFGGSNCAVIIEGEASPL